MNWFERAVLTLAPSWALRRARARAQAQAYQSAYESLTPGRLRKKTRDAGSGNAAVRQAGPQLRSYARQLERNHDLARGVLDVLERNVIGPTGIGVDPAPMTRAGDVHGELADQLTTLWNDWTLRPEVTWSHDWPGAQRLLCRSWMRDGEALVQMLAGAVRFLDHGTRVPFSVELIEADLLDWEFDDAERNIVQGVQRDTWGRARFYHLFKQHPGDPGAYAVDRKALPADVVRHLRVIDRIGQVRGVSKFAAILSRLDDLKDYEESERIAAKVAASMAVAVISGDTSMYTPPGVGETETERNLSLGPGEIWWLQKGQDVKPIDTKRPNTALKEFRDGQMRAVASGAGAGYSSVSKNYDGTYSAQRQELVEQWAAYAVLQTEFINTVVRPVWQQFAAMAFLSQQVRVPADADPARLFDAVFTPPTMPWIDPKNEAEGLALLDDGGYIAPQEIIRRRGGSPRQVLEQRRSWLRLLGEYGLSPTTPEGNA